MSLSFNLLTEPWIPVRFGGETTIREVSLREILARAPDIATITDSSPLATIALHRLILALCHRIWGPADDGDWQRLWEQRAFDMAEFEAYAGQWHDRFDLFHPERPFYQCPGLPESLATTVAKLGSQFAAGNNALLFDHSVDDQPAAMRPAEAARMVVAQQAFAIGGLIAALPGEPRSAEGSHLIKAAVQLVLGSNLFETLALHLLPISGEDDSAHNLHPQDNLPAWEREPVTRAERTPAGLLDLLTWQSRRILLFPRDDGMVTKAALLAGYSLPSDFEVVKFESMVAYRAIEDRKAASPWAAIGFRPEQALWRDSVALLQFSEPVARRSSVLRWLAGLRAAGRLPDRPFELAAFGLATFQAKVFLWRAEEFTLPQPYLDDPNLVTALSQCLDAASAAARALRMATWGMASEALSPAGSADRQRVAALVDSLAPERPYWPVLDAPFRRLMVELARVYGPGNPGYTARGEWQQEVRGAATTAFELAAGALETSSRGYRAAAQQRDQFRAKLFHDTENLAPKEAAQ